MINKRQYNILSFYLTRSLFLGTGLSLLVGLSNNDILITGFVGLLLGYFLLYLFFKKGYVNNIVNIIIAISVLFINTLSNTILTNTFLLYTTPSLFIVLLFFLILIYASKFKFTIIGRISEVFIVVSFLEILLSLLGLFPFVELDNLLPLFNTKIINIMKGVLVFTASALLPNILLINYKDNLRFRDVQWGYIVGSLLMIIVLFLTITIYGSKFATMIRFPEFLILKKINIMGYFNNVENILVVEWMINILITALLCVKVIRDSCPKILFYIIIIGLLVGSEFIFTNSYANILLIKEYFYYIGLILILLGLITKKNKNY
ncbi:MAG: GerAB/ArcD/ProY family transporter [Candidatus Coprovivens sp.]